MSYEMYTAPAIVGVLLAIARGLAAAINAGRRPRSPDEMRANIQADSGRRDT